MPLSIRILFFGIIGFAAGLLIWPFSELAIFYQAAFPSLLLFSAVTGIGAGILMGGFFGGGEGIVSRAFNKIIPGIIMGMIIGAAGGLIGFVIGQALLLPLGTFFFNSEGAFKNFGIPLAKGLGWGAFGLFIGSVEGVRSKSLNKLLIGIAGGFTGGLFGGLVFELLRNASPNNPVYRLIGLIILGMAIGACYGLFENKMSKASLYVLNGRLKGKEFLLNAKKTSIGASPKTEIALEGYKQISKNHATIEKSKSNYVFTVADKLGSAAMATCINDGRTIKKTLADGDVIRVGNAQMQFRTR